MADENRIFSSPLRRYASEWRKVAMKKYMSISEFAEEVGVSAATLRNWEKNGRLKPHHRTAGNQRVYSREQIDIVLNMTGVTAEKESLDEKALMKRLEEYYDRLKAPRDESRVKIIKSYERDDVYVFNYADNSVTDSAGNRIMLDETPDGVQDVLVEDYIDDMFSQIYRSLRSISVGFKDERLHGGGRKLIRMV